MVFQALNPLNLSFLPQILFHQFFYVHSSILFNPHFPSFNIIFKISNTHFSYFPQQFWINNSHFSILSILLQILSNSNPPFLNFIIFSLLFLPRKLSLFAFFIYYYPEFLNFIITLTLTFRFFRTKNPVFILFPIKMPPFHFFI